MAKDVKIEILYFKNNTDVSLEFGLHGDYPMRLLTSSCNNLNSFFHSLKRAIMRSEIIIVVGGYQGNEYIPSFIAKSISKSTYTPDYKSQNIITDKKYIIPTDSIPLAPSSRIFGGFIIESGPQTIISLTDNKKVRVEIIKEIIVNYIKEHHAVFSNYNNSSVKNTINETVNSVFKNIDSEENVPLNDLKSDDEPTTSHNLNLDVFDTFKDYTFEEDLFEDDDDEYDDNEYNEENDEADNNVINNESTFNDELDDIQDDDDTFDEIISRVTDKYIKPENHNSNINLKLENDFFDFSYNNTAKKRHSHKKAVRVISIILVLLILLGSVAAVLFFEKINDPGKDYYAKLNNIFSSYKEDYLYAFNQIDDYNPSFKAWVTIKNSNINFPVTETNIFTDYLHNLSHLPNNKQSNLGTVFSTTLVSLDQYTGNIVLYGNADSSGAFSDLKNYLIKDYYSSHRDITFINRYNKTTWRVFSVFKSSDVGDFKYDCSAFDNSIEYNNYINTLQNSSIYDADCGLIENQPVIVLVGISNGEKYVVAGMITDCIENKEPSVEVNNTVSNTSSEDLPEPPNKVIIGINDNKDIYVGKEEGEEILEQEPNINNEVIIPPLPPVSSNSSISSNTSSQQNQVVISSNISSATPSVESIVSQVSSNVISSAVVSSEDSNQRPGINDPRILTWDINVSVKYNGNVEYGSAATIVGMMIEAEMGSHYPIEALKAHAVASYNWLIHNYVYSNNIPSVYLKHTDENSNAMKAVNAVKGQILMYGNTIAQTNYYACSAGKTANYQDVWQWNNWQNTTKVPTLQSVDCPVDEDEPVFKTTTTYTSEEIKSLIKSKLDIDVSNLPKTEWIVPRLYDSNNLYCVRVLIGGTDFQGQHLRTKLFGGYSSSNKKGLRSSAYQVSYDANTDIFTIVCKGWGHGVGMSQYGARDYAKQGWTYEQILTHFFTGTHINNYN